MEHTFESRAEVKMLSEVLLMACKELIDDAKNGCADLVFKDICLEILARAKQVLTDAQFKELSYYAAERIKEKSSMREAELPI
jgi:hypothetical protein